MFLATNIFPLTPCSVKASPTVQCSTQLDTLQSLYPQNPSLRRPADSIRLNYTKVSIFLEGSILNISREFCTK